MPRKSKAAAAEQQEQNPVAAESAAAESLAPAEPDATNAGLVTSSTAVFSMKPRAYLARCEDLKSYKIEINGNEIERWRYKLRLLGVTPMDCLGSQLMDAAFVPVPDDQPPPDKDDPSFPDWWNSHHTPLNLDKGNRKDMDAGHKLQVRATIGPLADAGLMLINPREGIHLQEIVPSKDYDGCVDIVVIAKGLDCPAPGWRTSVFEISFPGKTQAECNADSAAKPRRGRKPKEAAKPEEEPKDTGPKLFDAQEAPDESQVDKLALVDCSPDSLDELPLGLLVIGPDGSSLRDGWRKVGVSGNCWRSDETNTFKDSSELIDYAGSYIVFSFEPDNGGAEVPAPFAQFVLGDKG